MSLQEFYLSKINEYLLTGDESMVQYYENLLKITRLNDYKTQQKSTGEAK